MKRAVLILAVILVSSTLAFAVPTFSLGTWGRTILNLAEGNTGANSIITQSWGPSGWGPCQRLQFAITSDAMDVNVKVNYRFDKLNAANQNELQNVYGTVRFIPDMMTLFIGKISGDGIDNFRKTSEHSLRDQNNKDVGRLNGTGAVILIAPKDSGFEAGLLWRVDGDQGNLMNNVLSTGIAASYKVPDMVKITAGSTQEQDNNVAMIYTNSKRNVFGRVELLMVKGLNLWVDARYYGFETEQTASYLKALLAGSYTMDALKIIWAAYFDMTTTKATGTATSQNWYVSPEFQYTMGDLVLGFEAAVNGELVANKIGFDVEPYVKLKKFNTRLSVEVSCADIGAATPLIAWKVPVTIDFSIW